MPIELPAQPSPDAMLVASLVLVTVLLAVFWRKSMYADRLAVMAERRADAAVERIERLEQELERPPSEAEPDAVVEVVQGLARWLRIPDDARTPEQVGDAIGAALVRTLDPEQWMVFRDRQGDGREFALTASGSRGAGTWPVGACLTPQMGRVGLAIRRKRAMDATDFLAEPPIVRAQVEETEPKVFRIDLVTPVVDRDRVVGAIAVGGCRHPSHLSRAVLHLAADRLALQHRFEIVRRRAAHLEDLDSVTGLHNRNWFIAHGAELMFRNKESLRRVTCAFFGVDDFRTYGSREGPSAAHRLLRSVAQRVSPAFRGSDLLCRFEDEQFAALLPNADRAEAIDLLDRLRRAVAEEPFEGAAQQPEGCVTLSVGFATSPEDGTTFEELLQHAYRAFRTSTRRGGDRTSGEIEIDEEFLDIVSGLAEAQALRAPADAGDLG